MLRSLLDSSTGSFEVVCLVTEPIPERMQEILVRLGAGRLSFRYLPLKGRLEGIYTNPRYTEAASFRLLLPELLPEYDRIVYIDCDVIVRQDVGKLYAETDLCQNWLGAVFEAPIEQQAERFRALGCDPNRYFNSGFLLMNLKQMRADKVSEKLLAACRVPYLEFPDQDALNQVYQGHVLPLSPLYNGIRLLHSEVPPRFHPPVQCAVLGRSARSGYDPLYRRQAMAALHGQIRGMVEDL